MAAQIMMPHYWSSLEQHKTQSIDSIVEQFLSEFDAMRNRLWSGLTETKHARKSFGSCPFHTSIDQFLSEFQTMRSKLWSETVFNSTNDYHIRPIHSSINEFVEEMQRLKNRLWKKEVIEHRNTNGDKFEVIIDVSQFKPEELIVKTVNNVIIIEGKHEERKDQSNFVSQHFHRKYTVSAGHNIEKMVPVLSNGLLTITVPRFEGKEIKESIIPVQRIESNKKSNEEKVQKKINNEEKVQKKINAESSMEQIFEKSSSTHTESNSMKHRERIIPVERIGSDKTFTSKYSKLAETHKNSNSQKESSKINHQERTIPVEHYAVNSTEYKSNYSSTLKDQKSSDSTSKERIIPVEQTTSSKYSSRLEDQKFLNSSKTQEHSDKISNFSKTHQNSQKESSTKINHQERTIPVEHYAINATEYKSNYSSTLKDQKSSDSKERIIPVEQTKTSKYSSTLEDQKFLNSIKTQEGSEKMNSKTSSYLNETSHQERVNADKNTGMEAKSSNFVDEIQKYLNSNSTQEKVSKINETNRHEQIIPVAQTTEQSSKYSSVEEEKISNNSKLQSEKVAEIHKYLNSTQETLSKISNMSETDHHERITPVAQTAEQSSKYSSVEEQKISNNSKLQSGKDAKLNYYSLESEYETSIKSNRPEISTETQSCSKQERIIPIENTKSTLESKYSSTEDQKNSKIQNTERNMKSNTDSIKNHFDRKYETSIDSISEDQILENETKTCYLSEQSKLQHDRKYNSSISICSVDSNATNDTLRSEMQSHQQIEHIIPIERARDYRSSISICSLDSNATILANQSEHTEQNPQIQSSASVCSMDSNATELDYSESRYKHESTYQSETTGKY